MIEQETISEILTEFPERARRKAALISNHIAENFDYMPWTGAQKKEMVRRRSLAQIRKSGQINYLVPCIDTAAETTAFLSEMGEEAYMVIFTEQGALTRFMEERKGRVYLDAAVEFTIDGQTFIEDVGASDVSLMKLADGQKGGYVVLDTTRLDERQWRRNELIRVSGRTLTEKGNMDKPVLEVALDSQGGLPLGLKREDFTTFYDVIDADSFRIESADNLADYNSGRDWNQRWIEEQGAKIFPGIKPFNYPYKKAA